MIRGEKVVLRPVDLADVDRLTAWINDPEVTEYLSFWLPLSRTAEEEWVRTEQPGVTRFAIDTLEGTHIGVCGLHAGPANDRCAGLGIFIGDKEHWGEGYGTDAVITACAFAFAWQNLRRVHLTADAENARAIRVYEKAGFTLEGTLREHRYKRGRYCDVVCMGLLRREFEERHSERLRQAVTGS